MKVVADSHAIVWYIAGSDRLSERAAEALREAEQSEGIVVLVATLVVTRDGPIQKTKLVPTIW